MQYNESTIVKFFRIISPVLLFEVISFATSFVVSLMFISEYGAIYYDPNDVTSVQTVYSKLYEGLAKYSVIITLAAALVALPLLIRMRKKDELRRDYRIIPSSIPKWSFVVSVLVGALLCYGLNMLIELSQISQTYTGVQEALELIYAGGLPLRIIAVGIIVPAIEELVFRGLIYRRLRDYASLLPSVMLASLIFGIYHGNLVQGIYAFAIGAAFALLYEKTGSIIAPCAAHIGTNLTAIIISEILSTWPSELVMGVTGVITSAIGALLVWLVWKKVKIKIEYIDIYAEADPGMEYNERNSRW